MPEEEAKEVVEEIIKSEAEKHGDVVISSQVEVKEEEAGSCVLSLSLSLSFFACGFGMLGSLEHGPFPSFHHGVAASLRPFLTHLPRPFRRTLPMVLAPW